MSMQPNTNIEITDEHGSQWSFSTYLHLSGEIMLLATAENHDYLLSAPLFEKSSLINPTTTLAEAVALADMGSMSEVSDLTELSEAELKALMGWLKISDASDKIIAHALRAAEKG